MCVYPRNDDGTAEETPLLFVEHVVGATFNILVLVCYKHVYYIVTTLWSMFRPWESRVSCVSLATQVETHQTKHTNESGTREPTRGTSPSNQRTPFVVKKKKKNEPCCAR